MRLASHLLHITVTLNHLTTNTHVINCVCRYKKQDLKYSDEHYC